MSKTIKEVVDVSIEPDPIGLTPLVCAIGLSPLVTRQKRGNGSRECEAVAMHKFINQEPVVEIEQSVIKKQGDK